MNSKRLYFLMLAAIGLLVAALIGGAYGANSLLATEAENLKQARTKSLVLEAQQQQLIKAKNEILKYKGLADIAKSVVPQDKDQAQTVREIVNIAAANGIRLGSITFPSSTLGTAPVAAPKPAAGDGEAATPAAPAPVPPTSQLKAVPTIPGVFDLAITVQSDTNSPAPYGKFLDFLHDLEQNRRTALVTGIQIAPDSKDPSRVSFTLNINEYIKP